MSGTVPDKASVEAMSDLARGIDPLYLPAQLLLGYLCLQRGDGEGAAAAFQPLVEGFRREVNLKAALLRGNFTVTPKHLKWFKRSRIVKRWADYYFNVLSYLHGGDYYIAGTVWQHLREELAEKSKRELSDFDKAH